MKLLLMCGASVEEEDIPWSDTSVILGSKNGCETLLNQAMYPETQSNGVSMTSDVLARCDKSCSHRSSICSDVSAGLELDPYGGIV